MGLGEAPGIRAFPLEEGAKEARLRGSHGMKRREELGGTGNFYEPLTFQNNENMLKLFINKDQFTSKRKHKGSLS